MFWSPDKYARQGVKANDGVPLHWGVQRDGYPVRAAGPFAIEKEQIPRIHLHPYARSEVLEIPRQLDQYRIIIDWIAATKGVLRYEERVPDPAKPGTWWVWLTWFDVQGVLPAGAGLPRPALSTAAPEAGPTYTVGTTR